jgi:tetratricopeptide (TPR) repeat protein
MVQNGGFEIPEDVRRRAEEISNLAEKKETERIDELTSRKAKEFVELRNKNANARHAENLQAAHRIRKQTEADLLDGEQIIQQKLQLERSKKSDTRKREIAERKRREEEEKRKQVEEETKRQITEEKNRVELEKRKRAEEELRRQDEDRQRREAQARREDEERENRIHAMLQQAENYLQQGDFDLALIETAKALVNDPNHAGVLALKQKIIAAQQPGQTQSVEGIELGEVRKEEQLQEQEKEDVPQKQVPKFVKYPRKKISKKTRLIAAAAVVIFAVMIVLLRYGPTIIKHTPTIAVLPLVSSSGVLEDDILGNALAADIDMRLSSIKGFKPLGISSVMALKNIGADLNKSINQAGYNYILSGTISRMGDSRIINVRLIDSLNKIIFEKNFSKAPNTFNDLSSDLCKELANKLGVKLEDDLVLREPTFDQTAYLMYLRGLELLNRKTLASYNNAQELFDQAASADNGFADAFAMSGFVSVAKIENNWDIRESVFQKAEEKLQRALLASPKSVIAKQNLGLLFAYQKNFKEAHKELNDAISLAPNYAANYLGIAKLFNLTGKYNDAKDALLRATDLDPFNIEVGEMLANTYQLLDDYKEAYSVYQKIYTLISDPSLLMLNFVSNAILFDSDLKVKYAQQLIDLSESRIRINAQDYIGMYKLARTYQGIGKNSDAMPILEKATKIIESEAIRNPNDPKLSIYLALINTRMGKYSEAIKFANRSLLQDSENVEIKYKVARMYAIQNKDSLSISYLKKSVNMQFNLNEILDIDFFNLKTKPEFLSTIKLKDK